jgi:hypothetical protein
LTQSFFSFWYIFFVLTLFYSTTYAHTKYEHVASACVCVRVCVCECVCAIIVICSLPKCYVNRFISGNQHGGSLILSSCMHPPFWLNLKSRNQFTVINHIFLPHMSKERVAYLASTEREREYFFSALPRPCPRTNFIQQDETRAEFSTLDAAAGLPRTYCAAQQYGLT